VQTFAILVAAGRGERMNAETPKAFLRLGDETLLEHSARAFQESSRVSAIAAIVPLDHAPEARRLLARFPKVTAVAAGGARRQDSVLEGMKQAPDGFDGIVLVHDAARPLVDVALIEAIIDAAEAHGAAIPVVPVVDTIKRVEGDRVTATIDRSQLGAAQTPQGFSFSLLAGAYQAAFRDHVTLTDEAMAVERLGQPVAAVPGSPRNRKLTTPQDLIWAREQLQASTRG
jgi:2-C-methyl-D-erythritol 4-phosphate cytidylyltransferase